MRNIILLPHIKVQNANALSSPFTIGFPAMTAWLGAIHALQRKINAGGLKSAKFNSVAVISHNFELQTHKGVGDYVHSIIGTGKPLVKKKKRKKGEPWDQFEKPPFIEEARCHLDVSLFVEYSGISNADKKRMLDNITHHLNASIKIAGGDILSFYQPELFSLPEGDSSALKELFRRAMPGFAIVERRELMASAMNDGRDAIDALLDYLLVYRHCEQDSAGRVTWSSQRKAVGWIVPIATGFHGISELGQAKNQRDPLAPHRFAESLVTLGEFRMLHRINSLDDILWSYHTDIKNHLYLCRQNNQ